MSTELTLSRDRHILFVELVGIFSIASCAIFLLYMQKPVFALAGLLFVPVAMAKIRMLIWNPPILRITSNGVYFLKWTGSLKFIRWERLGSIRLGWEYDYATRHHLGINRFRYIQFSSASDPERYERVSDKKYPQLIEQVVPFLLQFPSAKSLIETSNANGELERVARSLPARSAAVNILAPTALVCMGTYVYKIEGKIGLALLAFVVAALTLALNFWIVNSRLGRDPGINRQDLG